VSLSDQPQREAGVRSNPADAHSPRPAMSGPLSPPAGGGDAAAIAQPFFAEVAHAVQGRVRLRIPAAKTNPVLLDQLKTTIGQVQGVDAIEVKATSGSLVIYYDTEHHPEVSALLQCLGQKETAPLTIAPQPPPAPRRPPLTRADELTGEIEDEAAFLAEHSTIARSVVGAVKQLDKDIKRSTNNNMDLKIMVPVALAGVTFLEIGAAAATPMWVTLAIFSLNHFVELHAHDADEK
jgi:hypothetical protein